MAKAKAEKVVIEIDGETFEVPRSALKSVKNSVKKAKVPTADKIMKDIKSHDSKLHDDLVAIFSNYMGSVKLSVPGIGCKKGSLEFFFGIEGEDVQPVNFRMKLTNLDCDQMPAFMDYWCDERTLKDFFNIDELFDQVMRLQDSSTMDKVDKMINKMIEKYQALYDRVVKFIKNHYGVDGVDAQRAADDVLAHYDNSYGGVLEWCSNA